jgi:hypothetical protein
MKTQKIFMLVGTDCDGDTREMSFDSIERARIVANLSGWRAGDGLPWQSWEIWGNDPDTGEWKAMDSSDNTKGLA